MIDRIAGNGTTLSLCHQQEAALTGSWWNCDWALAVEAVYLSVEIERMQTELADWFVGGKSDHLKLPCSSAMQAHRGASRFLGSDFLASSG